MLSDEEKAEEYILNEAKKMGHTILKIDDIDIANWKTSEIKQAYLGGLAEGRQEVTYMTADEYDKTLDNCEEHAKKSWLKTILKEKRKSSTEYTCTELDMYELGCENGINEVCKKILDVANKMWFGDSYYEDLESIIKDLGIEL